MIKNHKSTSIKISTNHLLHRYSAVLFTIMGNITVAYDIVLYQYLAHTISKFFFNPESSYAIFFTQLIFLIGVLSRPIGAFFFSTIADLRGRRVSMQKTIVLSGLSTSLIAFIPGYQTIGLLSPVLLVCCRFLQGFSIGGENPASLAFIFEHSAPKRKGFICSLGRMGPTIGSIIACILTALFIKLQDYGTLFFEQSWRLLFLLSGVLSLITVLMRKHVSETLDFIVNHSTNSFDHFLLSIKNQYQENKKKWLSVLSIIALGNTSTYVTFIYIPRIIATTSNYSLEKALTLNCFFMILMVIQFPIFGYISDIIGRTKVLSLACAILGCCWFPLFYSLDLSYPLVAISILFFMTSPLAAYYACAPILIIEAFTSSTRCIMYSIFYVIPSSIIVGATPLAMEKISMMENCDIIIALILSFLTVLAAFFLLLTREPIESYKVIPQYSLEHLKL